jgi:acetyl esterase/lipase
MTPTVRLLTLTVSLSILNVAPAPFFARASGNPARLGTHGPCRDDDRGRVLRVERVASYPTAANARAYFDEWIAFYQDYYQFPADLPAQFHFGFDSYRVTYCTTDARLPGERAPRPAAATGMVSVPRRAGPLSTVAYVHGTSVSFYDVVSNPNIAGRFSERGESFEGPPSNAVFAGGGFIYVGPDYLGLGGSPIPRHRYLHAETEAGSAVDLLTATDRVLVGLRVRRNDKLFVFGFSQGGHSALALHRALQDAEVEVTATATVGGIYDAEQWFLSLLTGETSVTLPLYAAYILLAYDDIYDIFGRTSEVFRQPYDAAVNELFDMRHYFDDVFGGLAPTSRDMVTTTFFGEVTRDPHHRLRVRLRENNVDRWRPRAPLRFYHSSVDEEVPFADALLSARRLRARGADVSVRVIDGFDHVNSWIQAMPRAAAWFREFD